MDYPDDEWQRKGAPLSDKTACEESGGFARGSAELPSRPESSPPKLVDECRWIRIAGRPSANGQGGGPSIRGWCGSEPRWEHRRVCLCAR
jgi:hypothetical protein